MVKNQVKKTAFTVLSMECQATNKTSHLKYERVEMCAYICQLDARIIIKARLRIYDLAANFRRFYAKSLLCPFCAISEEDFSDILY